jgi:RNA processing factor Prp31
MAHKSSWSDLYIAAALESNDEVLIARITAAKHAIAARLEQLSREADGYKERQAINAALERLRTLESERIPR